MTMKLTYSLEVDRAIDNLAKSGKMPGAMFGGRRDSVPMGGPPRGDFSQQFGKSNLYIIYLPGLIYGRPTYGRGSSKAPLSHGIW